MKKRIVRITAALCTAALLAGCGGSISSKDGGYYSTEAAAQESYNSDSAAGSVDSGLVPENAAEAATDETAQKIIYNASLSMESTDFDTTREALMTAVEANGAWLESTSLYGTEKDHDRTADYTVRVPVGSYRAFLAAVGDAGSVLNISESAENITSSYIDVQARLSALEAQRDRLNALADQAETTADLLEIESQLSDVQYQLENYTRQLRSMDQQVSYSTVDIYLREVATLTPTGVTFGERIADAFGGGWASTPEMRTFIVVDGIKFNGQEAPNGGFETLKPDLSAPRIWNLGSKSKACLVEDAKEGKKAMKLNHANRIGQGLKVEAGKRYTISLFATAAK